MKSLNSDVHRRFSLPGPSRALVVHVAAVICALHLAGPLQGQTASWQSPNSTTLYAPAGVSVGIGTSTPETPLHLSASGESTGQLELQATSPNGWAWLNYNANGYYWETGVGGSGITDGSANKYWIYDSNAGSYRLVIDTTGKVGIGTMTPQYLLSVNGTIGTKEVIVTNTGWADYVFKPGYRLRPLSEVAADITQHQRLPDIPSEREIQEKGMSLGEMQVKLLAKIEELTLSMIQEHRRNDRLEQQNRDLQQRLARLEARERP
jgi:hypothetical protein